MSPPPDPNYTYTAAGRLSYIPLICLPGQCVPTNPDANDVYICQPCTSLWKRSVINNTSGVDWEFDLDVPEDEPYDLTKRCVVCRVEISPFLDAYYGKDFGEAGKCSNCRDGRGRASFNADTSF